MEIKDKEVLKLLNRVNCYDLRNGIELFPEEERDGKSDMEIFLEELDYLLELFEEDSTLRDDLIEARDFIKKTKNGKVILLNGDLSPVYTPSGFDLVLKRSRDIVNEYNRVMKLAKELGRR